jgi:pimeloyl-ACP methyl ester carboxylesterase
VIFLDGAGWYTGDGPVRRGLKDAGYPGVVERFGWSTMLGAPLDHAVAGPDLSKTEELTERIVTLRNDNPDGHIVLMGLSAGTTIIVYALEKLPQGVRVDEVVLLSSSISGRTDIREALRHVNGKMYVTTSMHDHVLALGDSSGPEAGEPAGRSGFSPPIEMSLGGTGQWLYDKVAYVPWREEYDDLGWSGSHTSVTSHKFIETVIAPKIMLPQWAAPRPAPLPPALAESSSKPAPGKTPPPAAQLVDRKAAGFLKTLFSGEDSERRSAAKELRKFNAPPVVAGLIDALTRDGSEDVRKEAAVSLGELNVREAQSALRKASREDRDSGVRKAALKSAQKIEETYKIQP